MYLGYFFDSILNPPDPKIDQLSISPCSKTAQSNIGVDF